MKRSEKEKYLNNIINIISLNDFIILVNFKHLTASDSVNLRSEVKSTGGGFTIVKNSLVRIAIARTNKFHFLLDKFSGPTAMIHSSDMVATTKILMSFIDNNREKISIICATNSDSLLTKNDLTMLAKLPSLDEIRIKIMRLILNVPIRLAFSLNLPAVRMFRALNLKR